MSFDYTKDTKQHYKSDEVAQSYHDEFANPKGLNGLRFRFIAWRERDAVRKLLALVPHGRVLDVPTGTGKMAPVFAGLGSRVTPCDVSENMLALARRSYAESGTLTDQFHVVDLEVATTILQSTFDAVVCVRLMHRVPDAVKLRMLSEISKLAPYAVVSFGVENGYAKFRRGVRRFLMGGIDAGVETRGSFKKNTALAEIDFDIVKAQPIASVLSSEWMFLLKSKNYAPPMAT